MWFRAVVDYEFDLVVSPYVVMMAMATRRDEQCYRTAQAAATSRRAFAFP
jgi:hypothetical protein